MAIPQVSTNVTRIGFLGILRFLWKHLFWVIFFIVTIPTIYSSIHIAVQTNNPSYPFIQLGISLTNADSQIYDLVKDLRENPSQVIGMEKPTIGYWNHLVYYWKVFLVYFKVFSLLWLISIPFIFIYKFVRTRNTSEPAKNFYKTILYGFIFIFIINLIIILVKAIDGSLVYTFPENAGIFTKSLQIIYLTLPFHGVISLISYLINLLVY